MVPSDAVARECVGHGFDPARVEVRPLGVARRSTCPMRTWSG